MTSDWVHLRFPPFHMIKESNMNTPIAHNRTDLEQSTITSPRRSFLKGAIASATRSALPVGATSLAALAAAQTAQRGSGRPFIMSTDLRKTLPRFSAGVMKANQTIPDFLKAFAEKKGQPVLTLLWYG